MNNTPPSNAIVLLFFLRWKRFRGALGVMAYLGLTGATLSATPINVYVSPTGNDATGTGSSSAPWATIDHARVAIQSMSHADNIIVNVRAGQYVIASPIHFGVADSGGGNGFSVIYLSVDGIGAAQLMGAASLPTTGWLFSTGAKWSRYLGATNTNPLATLYENGARAWKARHPNYVYNARYPLARGGYSVSTSGGQSGSTAWMKYAATDFSASNPSTWTLEPSAGVVWWKGPGTENWDDSLVQQLNLIDTTSLTFTFTSDPHPTFIPANERFFIEGIAQLLDANGEYFYDAVAGNLTYRTLDGTSPNGSSKDIRAPLTTQLINLTGMSVTARVHDIQFSGFKVAYTNNPTEGAIDGAFFLQSTDHILIQNCEITDVGSLAILMTGANQTNKVSGCWIHRCGIGGVVIMDLLQRTTAMPNISDGHTVTNCRISDLGEIYVNGLYTAAVLFWGTSNSQVTHCDISRSGRYATSLRGNYSQLAGGDPSTYDLGNNPAIGNSFSYIRVTGCLMDSGDAGEVHAAACNPAGGPNINYWSQIVISGAYADPSMLDRAPNGIFLDHPHSCLDQNFSNIKISWTQGGPYRTYANDYSDPGSGDTNPADKQTTFNVSWTGVFDPSLMDEANIGVLSNFPFTLQSDDPDNSHSTSPTVIVNDHTTDYQEFGSTLWSDSTIPNLYNGDGRYHVGIASTSYAKWTASLPYTGTYQVYAWQMGDDVNASVAAPFTVFHNVGSTTVPISQQTGTVNTWVPLGAYRFAAGRAPASGYIQLSANTSDQKAVRADAVKFVLLGNPLTTLGCEQGWWTFDNVLCDDSGNGLGVSLMPAGSGPTFVGAGGPNGSVDCLSFDGIDDYATVSNKPGFSDAPGLNIGTGDFAISTWFYRTANPEVNLRLLSKGAGNSSQKGYAILGGNNWIGVVLSNGAASVTTGCNFKSLNQWNHLVVNVSRSNGTVSIYLNGVQSSTADISGWSGMDITPSPVVPLNFGRDPSAGLYWSGRIGEVRIYQRTLAAAEITTLATTVSP